MHGQGHSAFEAFSGLEAKPRSVDTESMSELSIHIGWEYFLGVVGTLIGIAYYTNGRLTRLETTVDWVKEALARLTTKLESPTDGRDMRPRTTPKVARRSASR